MAQNPDNSENIVALRRIEGQIRGVQRMIQQKQYCIDILNQISAVKGALTRIEENILTKHIRNCVTNAIKGNSQEEREIKLEEIMHLLHVYKK